MLKKISLFVLIGIVIIIVLAVIFFPRHILSIPELKQLTGSNKTCPDPLVLQTPVDLGKVTSILYPGQVRGGDFKPHGGFRFDNSKFDEVEVKAPIDGQITGAARYIEQGKVQYLFDFKTTCGIRYRFDHLVTLSPKLEEIAQNLPEAKENDSRTTQVSKEVLVSTGEVIATAVGYENNVFVDFGVFEDNGQMFQNPRSNPICWFDLLSSEDRSKVKSLPPADSTSGTQSTVCKP